MTDREPGDDDPKLVNPFDELISGTPARDPVQDPALEETRAMDRVEDDLEPTQAIGRVDAPAEPTVAIAADGTPIDSLFDDSQFREYDAITGAFERPTFRREGQVRPPKEPAIERSAGLSRMQKTLIWVAVGIVAVLTLAALFLLGTRLPGLTGSAAVLPTPSATPTPTPTPTAPPVGPVAPGEYAWDELLGGECLDPFVDPWAQEFTVVDCALPHPAQLVFRGVFPAAASEQPEYPGAAALQSQISLLCSPPGVVDLAVAGQYTDIELQGSYPLDDEQWTDDPSYYCFVDRASGEPISGSLAVPAPASAG